jgi:hypothetical protein
VASQAAENENGAQNFARGGNDRYLWENIFEKILQI